MDLGLSGKTALVCASTAGLGAATARALAGERANVVISGRRGRQVREIAATLPSAIGVEVDLTEPDGPEQLVAQAASAFGDIDIDIDIVNLLLPGRIATDRLAGIVEFVAERSGQSLAAVKAQGQREIPTGRYSVPRSSARSPPSGAANPRLM